MERGFPSANHMKSQRNFMCPILGISNGRPIVRSGVRKRSIKYWESQATFFVKPTPTNASCEVQFIEQKMRSRTLLEEHKHHECFVIIALQK